MCNIFTTNFKKPFDKSCRIVYHNTCKEQKQATRKGNKNMKHYYIVADGRVAIVETDNLSRTIARLCTEYELDQIDMVQLITKAEYDEWQAMGA